MWEGCGPLLMKVFVTTSTTGIILPQIRHSRCGHGLGGVCHHIKRFPPTSKDVKREGIGNHYAWGGWREHCIFYHTLPPPPKQVNLCHGIPEDVVFQSCTAGAGTLTIEFTLLSRLLGDPVYENVARRAVRALWEHRHRHTGLVGKSTDIWNM